MISPVPHPRFPNAVWIKANASGTGSDCVEVAKLAAGLGVRDSKHPAGHVLRFSAAEFGLLAAALAER